MTRASAWTVDDIFAGDCGERWLARRGYNGHLVRRDFVTLGYHCFIRTGHRHRAQPTQNRPRVVSRSEVRMEDRYRAADPKCTTHMAPQKMFVLCGSNIYEGNV
jgi:hypothetical protein